MVQAWPVHLYHYSILSYNFTMLSRSEIQDYTAKLARLRITDEAEVKAVLDYVYSIATIAVSIYEKEKSISGRQNYAPGKEDCNNLDSCQYKGAG